MRRWLGARRPFVPGGTRLGLALGAALGGLAVLPARASDSREALEDEGAALRDRVAQLEGLVAAAGLRDPQGSRLLRASRPELDATVYGFLTS